MTRAEIVLWYGLKGKQLGYKFRRQHGVDQHILDFYCPELNLAVEVDGESHNSEIVRRRDQKRQKEIEAYGICFLRFTDDEVLGNPNRVVDAIEQKVRQLGMAPPPLYPLLLEEGRLCSGGTARLGDIKCTTSSSPPRL